MRSANLAAMADPQLRRTQLLSLGLFEILTENRLQMSAVPGVSVTVVVKLS